MVDKGEQRFRPDEKGNLPWSVWQQEEARKRQVETVKFMQEMDRMRRESLKAEEEFWEKLKDQDVGDKYSGEAFVQWFWARVGVLELRKNSGGSSRSGSAIGPTPRTSLHAASGVGGVEEGRTRG